MGKKMGKMMGNNFMKNPRALTGSLVEEMSKIEGSTKDVDAKVENAEPKMMPRLSRGKNMFKKVKKI